ncbi:unnamed protein product [Rotaria sp. Silwood1]|nr:unnamed protein product [Rotaria sp. Silwood1]
MRLNSGKYKPVSNVVYSTVIEDGDGPVKIDSHIDLAQKLCERGGQIINFGLSVECLKKGRIENESFNHIFVGFSILCNDTKLNKQKFKINGKNLSIITPQQTSTSSNLRLIISRAEYEDEEERLIEKILYTHTFEYVSHDSNDDFIE